jgi:hypothetical protein
MDISYLKNNYDLIIDHGIHYYSTHNNQYYYVHPVNSVLLDKIKHIFYHYKQSNNSILHNKIYSKFDKHQLGAFWHYTHDHSNNLIVRIIFDNAQIFTDTDFNHIIDFYKPCNNLSFSKYKKYKKKCKTLKNKHQNHVNINPKIKITNTTVNAVPANTPAK